MTMINPSAGGGFGYNLADADRIFTSAMTGLYGWTALGLGLAGAVAWLFASTGLFLLFTGFLGMILGFVLAIGCLFGMQFAARRGAPLAAVGALYLGFTALMGATLSSVFVVYSGASIAQAFAGACGLFAIMSVFGFTTKRDLSKIGMLAFIAIIGMVVVGLLNVLLFQSSGLQLLLSIITLPIFMGLTAWETQAVKQEAGEAAAMGNADAASRIALVGSAGMFLNIVNMFLALLHIFGFFGGDD